MTTSAFAAPELTTGWMSVPEQTGILAMPFGWRKERAAGVLVGLSRSDPKARRLAAFLLFFLGLGRG